jgi:predicted RND superfamily exporter protein
VFLKGNDFLVNNLIESVVLAIVLIMVLMLTLFTSFRMILISTIPSLVALVITAGLMGFVGIPLKPSTILVFSIAFGISSDGTLYFLTKYRHEIRKNKLSIGEAVRITISETGVSMIYTALVLFFGFGMFALSGFGGTQALGILISFTLIIAYCANLILLPAFLLSLEKHLTNKEFVQDKSILTDEMEEAVEDNKK